jgi:hypothetical protein
MSVNAGGNSREHSARRLLPLGGMQAILERLERTNRRAINILGWTTTLVIAEASVALLVSYLVH